MSPLMKTNTKNSEGMESGGPMPPGGRTEKQVAEGRAVSQSRPYLSCMLMVKLAKAILGSP